jgi:hypothetical protein
MHANASASAKVLPMARKSMRKTGRLRTTAEASGKSSAGLQPPIRLRNHDKDGAYAREKSRAATMSEVKVAPLISLALRPCPSREKVNSIESSPSSQEPSEMESNFIGVKASGCLWSYAFEDLPRKPQRPKTKDRIKSYFFPPMPCWMMLCISRALGIPRRVAGLSPNGPPSVLAAKVIVSPCA